MSADTSCSLQANVHEQLGYVKTMSLVLRSLALLTSRLPKMFLHRTNTGVHDIPRNAGDII